MGQTNPVTGNTFNQQVIPGPDQQVANPLQNRNIIWKGKKIYKVKISR